MDVNTQSADKQDPIRIVVMGATGSGKSTFINLASNARFKVGHTLQSCTASIQKTSTFPLDDRHMILIDTPGFDDDNKTELEILKSVADYLRDLHGEGKKVTGILYLYKISNNRMGGMAKKNFRLFRKLCGTDALKNVVIATTMWDKVTEEGADREEELGSTLFKPALDEDAKMVRHDGTLESAQNILRGFFENKPVPLQIQEEMFDKNIPLADTEVGQFIRALFLEQEKKHKEEMDRLREDMKEESEKGRKEIQEELEQEREELRRVQAQLRRWWFLSMILPLAPSRSPSPPPEPVKKEEGGGGCIIM